jgi:methionyl aminopeptidase
LVKDPWELGLMRQSGRRLAEVCAEVRSLVRPGVTTAELDEVAERAIRRLGGVPSFKGYQVGRVVFPATICASPNASVVHGIPNDVPLVDGDIVSLDLGLIYMGYHSDSAFTVAVGSVGADVRRLLDETERSLYEGVAQAMPGNRTGDVGHRIQAVLEAAGFGVVRDYVGHGIGRQLHEKPSVPNYGVSGSGQLIKEGMCLAIEPRSTMGDFRTKVLRDGWTVVTADGSLSAHFEHTVAITSRGAEVLTAIDSLGTV